MRVINAERLKESFSFLFLAQYGNYKITIINIATLLSAREALQNRKASA